AVWAISGRRTPRSWSDFSPTTRGSACHSSGSGTGLRSAATRRRGSAGSSPPLPDLSPTDHQPDGDAARADPGPARVADHEAAALQQSDALADPDEPERHENEGENRTASIHPISSDAILAPMDEGASEPPAKTAPTAASDAGQG